jgi:hypothetical protein
MVLRRRIQQHGLTPRLTMLLNAHNATPPTQNSSANLAARPARHYTNATIVKNRLIILSAIKK